MKSATSIVEIPLNKVVTNPYQPRTTFDQNALEELSESIKTLGLIQPITVRQIGSKFQIISGERRFRASRMAELQTIPAYIIKTDDRGLIEMAIVENIQREDLNVIEVALSFKRLIEECNLTQEQIADRV
ncbi:MAG: ParB/RepB/Spo0J family partition protein, partial [Alistipes sp.]|nr:ParB/RepB/Spo0J family partition protein [Candidatus Minthomonas equi]